MVLKDELFNQDLVTMFATEIKNVYPEFIEKPFIEDCVKGFPTLELKERMSHVEKMLEKHLTKDFIKDTEIFSKVVSNITRGHFIYGSMFEYIQVNGCTDEYVDLSLDLLGEYTKSFTAEFAIRPFLNKYPDKSLAQVLKWSKSNDFHKRRLASEGVRPSLPWAPKITVDYKAAAASLDNLYYDRERYVTRSVANHLNDISKIDPQFVVDTLHKWQKSNVQDQNEMDYIIKHSLRTLLKKGYPEALAFLGYKLHPNISITSFTLDSDTIHVGDVLAFEFVLDSRDTAHLMIDYIVHYPSKNPKRRTTKTYKYRVLKIEPKKVYKMNGKRSFKPISTRNFNPGIHTIEIQVNGVVMATKDFVLK